MSTQPEALRLADALSGVLYSAKDTVDAAAELRRLHAENEAMRNVANRGGHIAVAMSRIANLESQRDALLEALKDLTPPMPPADAPCHVGLVPQEKCAHCGRIARARAAIKAVEETK